MPFSEIKLPIKRNMREFEIGPETHRTSNEIKRNVPNVRIDRIKARRETFFLTAVTPKILGHPEFTR